LIVDSFDFGVLNTVVMILRKPLISFQPCQVCCVLFLVMSQQSLIRLWAYKN